MTRYLAMVAGAAISLASTIGYAQTPPPSTDSPSGQPSDAASAKRDPDRGNSGVNAPSAVVPGRSPATTGGPAINPPTPPSTDSNSGRPSDFSSGQKNPDR
jgi:hypothetical protein